MKKIILLISGTLLLFLYNNCAQPHGLGQNESGKVDPTGNGITYIENQGNGTPYGGKLNAGKYVPSANHICGSSFEETIQVTNEAGMQSIELNIPCENRSVQIDEADLAVSADKERLMHNDIGFAHELTPRARSKPYYMVACRTTEANFGAEILVYGPAPVYTFEHISLETGFSVYSANTSFELFGLSSSRHAFVGDNDQLALQERESGPNNFLGTWTSSAQETSQFQRMICDTLSGDPVNEW